jgi:hypothetical protein
MAKPPLAYGSQVRLKSPTPAPAAPDAATPDAPAGRAETAPPARRRPMESRSDPTVLYLHPDGKYELKRYALARGPKVKVHDLLLEAIEEWAERHGIAAPFRVPSDKPRKS